MSGQFSEDDAAAILKAAAELQQKSASSSAELGVSISDLKKIAEESGIDPVFVDQALVKRAAGSGHSDHAKVFEANLQGELAADRLDVVSEVLSSYRGLKPLAQVGRTVQGTVQAPWSVLQIEVGSRNGRTRVAVRPLYLQTFMFTGYVPALLSFLALVLGFALREPPIGLGISIALALVSWQVSSFGFKKAEDTALSALNTLIKGIEDEISIGTASSSRIAARQSDTAEDESAREAHVQG